MHPSAYHMCRMGVCSACSSTSKVHRKDKKNASIYIYICIYIYILYTYCIHIVYMCACTHTSTSMRMHVMICGGNDETLLHRHVPVTIWTKEAVCVVVCVYICIRVYMYVRIQVHLCICTYVIWCQIMKPLCTGMCVSPFGLKY
jgi:hypothetical protein